MLLRVQGSLQVRENLEDSQRNLTGRVLNFGHPLFALSFTEKDACRRCVGEDMAAYRFATISPAKSHGAGVTLDLIGLWGQLKFLVGEHNH